MTGTIRLDGTVGPIGGLTQKVSAPSTRTGSRCSWCRQSTGRTRRPRDGSASECLKDAGHGEVVMIPVATLDEALAALEDAGRRPARHGELTAVQRSVDDSNARPSTIHAVGCVALRRWPCRFPDPIRRRRRGCRRHLLHRPPWIRPGRGPGLPAHGRPPNSAACRNVNGSSNASSAPRRPTPTSARCSSTTSAHAPARRGDGPGADHGTRERRTRSVRRPSRPRRRC